MATVRLEGITKKYGSTVAVEDLSVEVRDGEFFCILGPSGAGKTTTLHVIAGLEEAERGEVHIGGEPMAGLHPRDRDVALFFQNLALYPHLTGFENIAFPLRQRRLPETEVRERVMEVASALRIEHLLDRRPGTFSGGEQQRVALGRSLVRRPKVYLLDEPLSNLDAKLRLDMRAELKRLQRDLGQTTIYVTPDQVEAMAMGDRVLVLDRGHVQQCGLPIEVYNHPVNRFVAGFLGSPSMNFINCRLSREEGRIEVRHPAFTLDVSRFHDVLRSEPHGCAIVLGVRAENIHLHSTPQENGAIAASVYVVETLGHKSVIDLKVGKDVIKVMGPEFAEYKYGQTVYLSFDLGRIHLIQTDSGRVLV